MTGVFSAGVAVFLAVGWLGVSFLAGALAVVFFGVDLALAFFATLLLGSEVAAVSWAFSAEGCLAVFVGAFLLGVFFAETFATGAFLVGRFVVALAAGGACGSGFPDIDLDFPLFDLDKGEVADGLGVGAFGVGNFGSELPCADSSEGFVG